MAAVAEEIAERLADVRGRIGDGVTVVGVTKGFGADTVRAAVEAGLADIGENYAQELVAKAAELGDDVGGGVGVGGVRWHFLGHVQRNKVGALRPHVVLWQGVDRVLDLGADVLVQVNLSGLAQRNGVSWEDAPALVAAMPRVRGLMGVATPGEERAQFRRLAALAKDLGLPEVSMGMSGDYEVAVEEGATMVRLGTRLFGPRPERPDLRR